MRFFGHPIHPMLVHFPIVLWTIAAGALMLSISTGLDHSTAQIAAAACAAAGFLLMGVGGWYGGRLVYEFGIAVKDRT